MARVGEAFGIGIIFDVVISHKAGADATEDVRAVRVEQWGGFLVLLLVVCSC